MTERTANASRRRLSIIGGGSSGLIMLKMALEFLDQDEWEVVCFEKSDSITGCWGNPYPGFVSTSTRYTTQFACFPICEATVNLDGGHSREEFFRNGEYGEYLESFADAFGLRDYIRLNHQVDRLARTDSGKWELSINGVAKTFDAVVVCTGLAAKPKPIDCPIPQLTAADLNRPNGLEKITNQRIVIVGGGESAVDYAHRLARPELNNRVCLSLRTGIRVSPRYHPIRGVPSDFLRNRLMLSVHPDIRNRLGQIFVELRILHQRQFERQFPARTSSAKGSDQDSVESERRRHWAFQLTKHAKDDLFNMFHNKSDDFLDSVGTGRIKIVGPACDDTQTRYFAFGDDSEPTIEFKPDAIVPAIGYESTLGQLSNKSITLTDFFLGCFHVQHANLFLIGFARPIIGNIPTISEMQARYVCGLISGAYSQPANAAHLHAVDANTIAACYPQLNSTAVYPVEMFPYCDRLAKLMNLTTGPTLTASPRSPLIWLRTKLAPATTMHYFSQATAANKALESAPIYMPPVLITFILLMKPVDWAYRILLWLFPGDASSNARKTRADPNVGQ